jgi:YD repeat-containing protein
VSYTYASNAVRTQFTLTQPGGSPWVQSYGYDLAGRLTNVTSPAGAFGYQYDPNRSLQVGRLLLPNGAAITNAYDALGRLEITA